MRNEKMIKQSKYEVLTEKGLIYMNSLSGSITLPSDLKSHNTVIDNILKIIQELDEIIRVP